MYSVASLPYFVLLLMVISSISGLVLYSACLVLRLEDQEGRKKISHSLPLFLGPLLAIPEIAILRTIYLGLECGGIIGRLQSTPWLFHLLFVCLLLGTGLFSVVREGRYRETHFVRSSIKEAVDTMPVGLCFADLQGRQVLVNNRMIAFSEQLTGHGLNSVTDFLQEIKDNEIVPDCLRIDLYENSEKDIYTFRMQDGLIMQLAKDELMVAEETYIQLVVTDITMQHDLYDDLMQTNHALLEQRQEMRNLADRLIQSNHEEELLDYKIKVHNDVGQMILATGQLLASNEGKIEEYRECAEDWIHLTEAFANMEGNKHQKDEELLAEIINVAEQIGCRVHFSSELPGRIVELSVVRQAIREAIVNAVRHGGATEVEISHTVQNQMIEIQISNNGTLPTKGFSMKGGLRNLYDSIRGDGGNLRARTGERFELVITLPYMEQEAK